MCRRALFSRTPLILLKYYVCEVLSLRILISERLFVNHWNFKNVLSNRSKVKTRKDLNKQFLMTKKLIRLSTCQRIINGYFELETSFSENQKWFLKFDEKFPWLINSNVLLVCQYGRKFFINSEKVFQEKKRFLRTLSRNVNQCWGYRNSSFQVL